VIESHRAHFIWEAVDTSEEKIQGEFRGYKVRDAWSVMISLKIQGEFRGYKVRDAWNVMISLKIQGEFRGYKVRDAWNVMISLKIQGEFRGYKVRDAWNRGYKVRDAWNVIISLFSPLTIGNLFVGPSEMTLCLTKRREIMLCHDTQWANHKAESFVYCWQRHMHVFSHICRSIGRHFRC